MKQTIILIIFLCFGISCSNNFYSTKSIQENQTLFKIKKIKTKESYYEIYAQRNDSIFKIISDRESKTLNKEKIKIKKEYSLYLRKTLPLDSVMGIPLASSLEINGFEMPDGNIVRLEKDTHYTIYRADNLKDLYLKY